MVLLQEPWLETGTNKKIIFRQKNKYTNMRKKNLRKKKSKVKLQQLNQSGTQMIKLTEAIIGG